MHNCTLLTLLHTYLGACDIIKVNANAATTLLLEDILGYVEVVLIIF